MKRERIREIASIIYLLIAFIFVISDIAIPIGILYLIIKFL